MRAGGKTIEGNLSPFNTREEISYLFLKFMHTPDARSFHIYETVWERIRGFFFKAKSQIPMNEEPVRVVEDVEPRIRLVVDNTRRM